MFILFRHFFDLSFSTNSVEVLVHVIKHINMAVLEPWDIEQSVFIAFHLVVSKRDSSHLTTYRESSRERERELFGRVALINPHVNEAQ